MMDFNMFSMDYQSQLSPWLHLAARSKDSDHWMPWPSPCWSDSASMVALELWCWWITNIPKQLVASCCRKGLYILGCTIQWNDLFHTLYCCLKNRWYLIQHINCSSSFFCQKCFDHHILQKTYLSPYSIYSLNKRKLQHTSPLSGTALDFPIFASNVSNPSVSSTWRSLSTARQVFNGSPFWELPILPEVFT